MSNYITILLTQGKETIIDEIDKDLAQFKWYANYQHGRWYAVRHSKMIDGKRTKIYLHKVILERKIDRSLIKGELVDHKNTTDSLDNRRGNLRIADKYSNNHNRVIHKNNQCGIKGVCYFKKTGKWKASIKSYGKSIHIGYYNTIEEAHKAYREASLKHHGEFGRFE